MLMKTVTQELAVAKERTEVAPWVRDAIGSLAQHPDYPECSAARRVSDGVVPPHGNERTIHALQQIRATIDGSQPIDRAGAVMAIDSLIIDLGCATRRPNAVDEERRNG